MNKSSDGRWKERGKGENLPLAGRLRRKLVLLPIAVLIIAIGVGFSAWRYQRALAAVPELPKDLEGRAGLLAQAWLKKDVPRMRQVTATTHDRVLYSWFVRHQPPARTGSEKEDESPVVQVIHRQDKKAQILVQVSGSDGRSPIEMRLFWEQRGDTWYFVPPPR
jgi:hypothetical protein